MQNESYYSCKKTKSETRRPYLEFSHDTCKMLRTSRKNEVSRPLNALALNSLGEVPNGNCPKAANRYYRWQKEVCGVVLPLSITSTLNA